MGDVWSLVLVCLPLHVLEVGHVVKLWKSLLKSSILLGKLLLELFRALVIFSNSLVDLAEVAVQLLILVLYSCIPAHRKISFDICRSFTGVLFELLIGSLILPR